MIVFENVSVSTIPEEEEEQPIDLVNDLSFSIKEGSVVLLTGPSGSGKSTVLRLINGLIPHVYETEISGQVLVDGVQPKDIPLHESGLKTGTIFQHPRSQFYSPIVGDELAFALQQNEIPRSEIIEKVKEVADLTGVSEWLAKSVESLSGGQLQRVACAAAITHEAKILLFDEPTSNLSPEAIKDFSRLLEKLKTLGHTIIIAEHRLFFMRELADQVILLQPNKPAKELGVETFFNQEETSRIESGLRTLTPPKLSLEEAVENTNADAGLNIENLKFSYGNTQVLGLDRLSFQKGKVSVIKGPNGAGKTTLASVIVGLQKANRKASISLNGEVLNAKQRRKRSAMVLQDVHRQLFNVNAKKELVSGLEHPEKVDTKEILEDIDLAKYAYRHPQSLSGGQQQRLAIGTAIAKDSEILVFDEPTSGVDLAHLNAISKRIRRLAESGAVVLVISHDLEFINACADLVYDLSPIVDGQNPLTINTLK